MSMPVIRLRQSVQFPANVYGDTGIDVTKANGNYTIETDWSQFTTLSAVPGSATNNVLTFDTATRNYAMVPTSLLGGGGGSGIVDAPTDGFSYGRLNAAWAKVAPLASPALTGTPTAPTAAPATNTTQVATTAFVGAAISASGGVTPSALTRTNDTNVTLTLGGTPTTALLQATSITAGWSGTLAAGRGGFGADVSAQSGVPLFASGTAAFTATIGTGNFVRAIAPTLTGLSSFDSVIMNGSIATPAHSSTLQIGSDASHSCIVTRSTIDGTNVVVFDNAAGAVAGLILQSSSSVSYNTTSDLRLKEDLKSFDAGNIIDDTEVYDFAWKSTSERAYGVVAQQAVQIYPQAVTHDEKLDWYGVDYSKYVPVILQELKALRARVRELEGRLEPKVVQ